MELVKENHKRWATSVSLVLGSIYLYLLTFSDIKILISTAFIIVLITFFTLIAYFRKKTHLILFSKDEISFNINNQANVFSWDDLVIDLKKKRHFIIQEYVYSFSSKKNNHKKIDFTITWDNEQSIIELTKKYVPSNHDFYKAVFEYAKRRGLNS